MSGRFFNVRFDENVLEALRFIANRDNVSVSDLVRYGTYLALEQNQQDIKLDWQVKPMVTCLTKPPTEEDTAQHRFRARAQNVARTQLIKKYPDQYKRLRAGHGRILARTLLVRIYYDEYQDLYRAAKRANHKES